MLTLRQRDRAHEGPLHFFGSRNKLWRLPFVIMLSSIAQGSTKGFLGALDTASYSRRMAGNRLEREKPIISHQRNFNDF